MSDATVPLAAIALVGSILGLVVTPLFKLLNANTEALAKVASSSERVAEATSRSAKEAKQRNGHLGEQNIQIAQLVASQNDDIASIRDTNAKIATTLSKSAIIAAEDRDTLVGPTSQVIQEQHVEHQTVEAKE